MVGAARVRSLLASTAGLVAVAAFLPWVSFGGFSASGVHGNGIFTLMAALVGLVLLLSPVRLGWLGQAVPAAIVVVTAADELGRLDGLAGVGVYLTLVAGAAWLLVALSLRAAGATFMLGADDI